MPGLLNDPTPTASDHDPATSHEHGPIEDRPERDPAGRALDDPVTEYARLLWTALDNVAGYLRDEIARGPSGPVLDDRPPALTTEEQWKQWRQCYASVLGVLAGPRGDQGYGDQEAQLEYQNNVGRSGAAN